MKRWISKKNGNGESPRVDAFLADVWAVCEKHGLAGGELPRATELLEDVFI